MEKALGSRLCSPELCLSEPIKYSNMTLMLVREIVECLERMSPSEPDMFLSKSGGEGCSAVQTVQFIFSTGK